MPGRLDIFYTEDSESNDLRPFASATGDHEQRLRTSILTLVSWLNDNVLKSPDRSVGRNLRDRLGKGIMFTDEMHRYLISSYNHWRTSPKRYRASVVENNPSTPTTFTVPMDAFVRTTLSLML